MTVIAILCSAWPRAGWAGGEAGNGGGVGEKYVLHAYLNLHEYIQICLDSSLCNLTAAENHLLTAIAQSLPQEYKTRNQIQFRSAASDKPFFTIGGLIRVAVTGDHVGDPIYVYAPELYTATGKPITLGFAISTLVHEFGHHHGAKDVPADTLDLLGEKVAKAYNMNKLVAQTVFYGDTISATYINWRSTQSELLISNDSSMIDVSKTLFIEANNGCHRGRFIDAYPIRARVFSDFYSVDKMAWGGLSLQYLATPLTVNVYSQDSVPYNVLVTFYVRDNSLNHSLSVVKVDCSAR